MTITLPLTTLPSKHETLEWITTDQAFMVGLMLAFSAVLLLGMWLETRHSRKVTEARFTERVARQMKERDNAAFLRGNGVHR